ncbi:MAG: carbohydrate binding family 9 domain-containing protein [Saprospiraceae bacterium]|uniref:Carbohydrate binding family 9 domain-containing protein n=1 Tax=Candidatus Opimibacter skivensis TaxID=2982028 RepID=A0A9D7SRV0_9BACT|nr:carbohydrate binding family 9 domain-containing protein [Candidatus Opimibacter skivensis]
MKYTITNLFFYLLLMSTSQTLFAQDAFANENITSAGIERRQYQTTSIGDEDISLDGIPNEIAWQKVDWASSFVQHEPDNGGKPAQQTSFKILQNNKYLYLAYRAFDTSPDSIVERLSRRDEFPGDWIEINIDSYHDLRTAFSFTFSVSGVKGDEFVTDDGGNWDDNWNPIWEGISHIDSLGWTAELRIPFSQFRYGNQTDPVWGFQVMRRVFRKEERSTWQPVPRNANGWVSQFGELHGLTNLPKNKQIELAPYILAQTEHFEKEPGNPFLDGSKNKLAVGLDGKLGITRDMILDFTINPDFGQVEADPGSIRLDGYEVFFNEQRPFFVENNNLFNYQVAGSAAGGEYDQDLLFYSRRIGGEPHGYPSLNAGEFADVPGNTSILGATKFSGKTKNGLSIGILESITDPIKATIANGESRRKEIVEPLSNYFVGRFVKDFDHGNTILGAILTSVNRKPGVAELNRSAYSGGIDFQRSWKNKWYQLKFDAIMSHVEGSKESILATQTGFVHLLQRSDAGHLGVDPSLTSLTGTGGTLKIGKYGGAGNKDGGVVHFETGVTWRSPHLELNDAGFLGAADQINHFAWASYALEQPFSIFRNARLNYNHWGRWDFGGRFIYLQFNTNAHFWFKNNWMIGGGFDINPLEISNNALRGATALRKPPGYGYNVNIQSDSRKKVTMNFNIFNGGGYHKEVTFFSVSGGVEYQPIDALSFSIAPGYGHFMRKQDQFVANVNIGNQVRSIVSNVNQQDFSISTRINCYFTPHLSLQYYGQPFIFRALYKNFGYVTKPLDIKYDDRFHTFSPQEITLSNGTAQVDENNDGQIDYTFSTPDFNYIQFRSNLVVRWEYVAGSELFLVWSQGIEPDAFGDLNTPIVHSLFENVFDSHPHNIFLLKFSYRFLN